MIALDTNVLARFYVDDPTDPEARRQSATARRLFETSEALFVPITVLLELEWVTLHVARSGSCSNFFSFDDRGFGRRARKLGVAAPVSLPPSK